MGNFGEIWRFNGKNRRFWVNFEGTKVKNLAFLRVGDFGDKKISPLAKFHHIELATLPKLTHLIEVIWINMRFFCILFVPCWCFTSNREIAQLKTRKLFYCCRQLMLRIVGEGNCYTSFWGWHRVNFDADGRCYQGPRQFHIKPVITL